ncbi:MAG: hypothetical protein ACFFD6_02900 [Candidatus Thorarchaeota archaeon]
MNKHEQAEAELDKLLLVLSKPLTRLILSILSGKDPGLAQNRLSERVDSSKDSP